MIPVNAPWLTDLERRYLLDAFDSGWITTGPYVERFEQAFAASVGRRHAVAVSSGTMALWVAVMALQIGRRAVITQDYTCDAVANAVISATGRSPLLVDVEYETWSMDADLLDRCGTPFSAVILAHTYGVIARDIQRITAWCRDRGVPLVEDASEAHGARLGGRAAGSFGDLGVFSLRGEKTLGAGQFGVVVTDDAGLAERVRQYAHNGLPVGRLRFWSTVPGLNAQPSNLHAALALAQLERLDELVGARNAVHARWRSLLPYGFARFQATHGDPAWWLTGILPNGPLLPQDIMAALAVDGIESRPGFYPLSMLPHVRQQPLVTQAGSVASMLLHHLVVLPSSPLLTEAEQRFVVERLLRVTGERAA